MKPEYRLMRSHPGHLCQASPEERGRVVHQIRTLMEKLGNAPCIPQPPVPPSMDFLCEKQPRFRPDPEEVPVITHVPLVELRPTADYKRLKKTEYQWRNTYFVPVDPPQSQHASPPWHAPDPPTQHALPCPKRQCVCCPQLKKFKMKETVLKPTKFRRSFTRKMDHDEMTCHAVGERRLNYLNQIRCILEQMDDSPCTKRCPKNKRPLIEYPGYLNRKNPEFKKEFAQPRIVNVPIRELRPTSEYWKHAHENEEKLQYYPVATQSNTHSSPPWHRPRYNSFELVGGEMQTGCDCSKHNGLQDQCRRTDCRGGEMCLTEPSPSCLPSQTIPVHYEKGLEEKFEDVLRNHPPRDKHYCCCQPGRDGYVDSRGLPQGFEGKACGAYV